MLSCKNCGGRLIFEDASQNIMCESCGNSRDIQSLLNGTTEPLYIGAEEDVKTINTYRRAMNMYLQGESVRTLDTAAQMFRNIADVFNAKDMVQKCQQKSEKLAKENSYRQAVEDMQSGDSRRVSSAIETLQLLADYKDAPQKASEARVLLNAVLQKEEEREKAKKQAKRIKLLTAMAVLAAVVAIIVIAMGAKAARYDSENLELSLKPCDEYLEVKGNRYVFYYTVRMENDGPVDIKGFRADVVIEDEDGKVLVDAQMQASDYTALVRKGKTREMTWELTVTDEDVALALYEEYSDLEVSITVTQMEFADGEIKDYS